MLSTKPVVAPGKLLSQAVSLGPVRAVIAGADHEIALESTVQAVRAGLIDPVLVGRAARIAELGEQLGIRPSEFEVIEAAGDEAIAEAAAARASADDVSMVVKGHVHTDAFMAALLKPEARIRTGRRLTHHFHMSVADSEKALIITDAAVNIAPDYKTRQAAILSAIEIARSTGIERPKVAILSATESVLPQMQSSLDAKELADWAQQTIHDADVAGPLAFDNAISPAAASLKGLDHPAAGYADILSVPNIETGNALFKMMVYFMGACAAGIVAGGRIPIVLTSRADPPQARLASIALARVSGGAKPG
ncbi:MAG: bifunctional enoyl-CoA hydratase/phosphate acetyltransferase [Rhizobiaceae bacterium]